jgi:uncharacterized protein YdcH (DUF465 family)
LFFWVGRQQADSRGVPFKIRKVFVEFVQKAVLVAFSGLHVPDVAARLLRLHDPGAGSRVKFPGGIFAAWVTDLNHALTFPFHRSPCTGHPAWTAGVCVPFIVCGRAYGAPVVLSRGGRIMFENQQRDDVEALMKADAEFRRLYQHHQELDSKVHDAEIGVLPIDDMTLSGMKKEKLHAKERLQRMWDSRSHRIN